RRRIHPVFAFGVFEIPGAAEIVFGAGAADRREGVVPVHVKLDLTFAPPTAIIDAPGDVRADVVALPLDAVDDGVDLLVGQRVAPAPLGMEVPGVVADVRQGVRDLVIDDG